MAGLVDRFDRKMEKMASEKRARPNRRQDKLDDINSGWEIGVGYSDKYSEGWDRIFGKKEDTDVRDNKRAN